MSTNRYVFDTVLEGYVNLGLPSGKFNSCNCAFSLPPEILEEAEKDRDELLKWARTKVEQPKRTTLNPPKWDDTGLIRYTFDGDTGRARPILLGPAKEELTVEQTTGVTRGTPVRIACTQVPYTRPALGTTLKIHVIQIKDLSKRTAGLSVEEAIQMLEGGG